MTKSLAKQVGYFPIFTWVSSMSGLMDTLLAATTGQKANLSTSPDSKMKDVLETVAIALRETIPSEKEARLTTEEEQKTMLEKLRNLVLNYGHGKREVKEKENEKSDEDKLDHTSIPVVVIDNFMYRETSKNSLLWDELSEWAALLIENSIAHVVFVSSNASVVKTLGKGK